MFKIIIAVSSIIFSLAGCSSLKSSSFMLNQQSEVSSAGPLVINDNSVKFSPKEKIELAFGKLLTSIKDVQLGKKLEVKDQELAGQLAKNSLEYSLDNYPMAWKNNETNHQGTFEITNTEGKAEQNLVCRNFVHTLEIDGDTEQVFGKACRSMWDPKEHWSLRNESYS
jgi:surface antigen